MPDHSKLAIPLGLESSLLPSPDLSLWDFASFELPRPSLAVAKAASEANNLLLEYRKTSLPMMYEPSWLPQTILWKYYMNMRRILSLPPTASQYGTYIFPVAEQTALG
jgi:hypothetical protein